MRSHDNSPTIWVLIADGTQADCYETKHLGKEVKLLKEYQHPENRKKGMDLVTDRPGHYQSRGTGHGAFVERHEPKESEAEHFAILLAKDINKGRASHAFEKLIVIAPAHFQGLMNKHFDTQVKSHILHHIEKDYVHYKPKELQILLEELPK